VLDNWKGPKGDIRHAKLIAAKPSAAELLANAVSPDAAGDEASPSPLQA
jgi:hypothetical protein